MRLKSNLSKVGEWKTAFAWFPRTVGYENSEKIRVWLEKYQWRYMSDYPPEERTHPFCFFKEYRTTNPGPGFTPHQQYASHD